MPGELLARTTVGPPCVLWSFLGGGARLALTSYTLSASIVSRRWVRAFPFIGANPALFTERNAENSCNHALRNDPPDSPLLILITGVNEPIVCGGNKLVNCEENPVMLMSFIRPPIVSGNYASRFNLFG